MAAKVLFGATWSLSSTFVCRRKCRWVREHRIVETQIRISNTLSFLEHFHTSLSVVRPKDRVQSVLASLCFFGTTKGRSQNVDCLLSSIVIPFTSLHHLSRLHSSAMDTPPNHSPLPPRRERLCETVHTYFKFGYTTFGGPAAHIGMLHEEMVTRRKWISNEQFTELFAICQALPGPASTELAYSLSLVRSGFLCACLAFLLWR